jgi:hypothetical protein
MIRLYVIFAFLFCTVKLSAQITENTVINILNEKERDSVDSTFQSPELIINFEIRPRAEYKNNFRLSDNGFFEPEFYISQRNRLGITYRFKNILFHASPQEIHLWNKSGIFSSIGNINSFELFLEPQLTKNFSLRIGRQGLSLDNGRLFSDAPWAQQSRAHEGVRLFYKKDKLQTDLTLASTRKYSGKFDPSWSPLASHLYKLLAVHHLHYKINENYTITTINYADVFDTEKTPEKKYYTVTNGGRMEYEGSEIYLTLNAYYQWGKSSGFKNIRAYYLQPEIKRIFDKTNFHLGAEILSGQNPILPGDQFNTFGINYGVAWKFMGNMNFFTRFPRDVNGSGLVNPYLFVIHKVNKKLSVRADGNLFYTQHRLKNPQNGFARPYLGFENDLSFEYKPVKNINIRYGLSYLLASESMNLLEKTENNDKIPVWSYLMVSFNPEILKVKRKSNKA